MYKANCLVQRLTHQEAGNEATARKNKNARSENNFNPRVCNYKINSLCRGETLVHFVPIHHVPPTLQIIGAAILVLQVVRVLPHIHAKNGRAERVNGALHKWIVLIRRADHFKRAAWFHNQPRPTTTETFHATVGKFGFEIFHGAKRFCNGRAQLRTWRAAATCWRHNLPEHAVVEMSAAVVANRATNGFWQ